VPEPPPAETVALPGTVFFDANGDGKLGSNEFSVKPWAARPAPGGPLLGFYSVELTEALAQKGLLQPPIASVQQAGDFWKLRDPALGNAWQGAVAKLPGLGVMVLATVEDHVQAEPDHPHIKVQLDGWRAANAKFVRLNPDASYVAQVGAQTSIDVPANQDITWTSLLDALEPEATETGQLLYAAAIEEMADRVHAGRWEPNLEAPIAW
jgi:hypothetical protein